MKQNELFEVGRIKGIFRYPVKSMRGHSLEEATVGWHGLAGDRRYAFVKTGNKSNFPWLTSRDITPMLLYTPNFVDLSNPTESPIVVKTPQDRELSIESDELLDELIQLYGKPAHLVQSNRGNFDSMTLSVISTSTIKALDEKLDSNFETRQFRQNILIENLDGEPFVEESWLGHTLHIGDSEQPIQIRLNRRIKRCMIINLNPDTAVQNPAVLREVANNRENCLGVFGTAQQIGRIRVGDIVRISKS